MERIAPQPSASARILEWIVGIVTVAFVLILAWLIIAGRLTPEFLLWTDASMIVTAGIGLVLFIITAIARYST